MNEIQIRLLIAAAGFSAGLFLGFLIWHNKDNNSRLSTLQVASIFMFFAYLAITAAFKVQYSDLVATAILAITGGELVGKAIAKKVEK